MDGTVVVKLAGMASDSHRHIAVLGDSQMARFRGSEGVAISHFSVITRRH